MLAEPRSHSRKTTHGKCLLLPVYDKAPVVLYMHCVETIQNYEFTDGEHSED